MSCSGSKSGFTLIELLIGMMCLPVILTVIIAILNSMSHVKIPKVRQIHVLKLQLQQSLNRATNISFEDKCMTYDFMGQFFTIELDGTRLVRRPGYEILLENVLEFTIKEDSFQICDEGDCIEV